MLEAAASGVPVVAVDAGGVSEIVRDGETGRLVPTSDPGDLAAALSDLAHNPDRARRLGNAAAAEVRARFGLDRMLAGLQDSYERLLAGGAK